MLQFLLYTVVVTSRRHHKNISSDSRFLKSGPKSEKLATVDFKVAVDSVGLRCSQGWHWKLPGDVSRGHLPPHHHNAPLPPWSTLFSNLPLNQLHNALTILPLKPIVCMVLMFGLLCMNEAAKSWDVPGKGPGITSLDENLTKLVLLCLNCSCKGEEWVFGARAVKEDLHCFEPGPKYYISMNSKTVFWIGYF